MGNIITQQASFYKYKIKETKTNIYGEAAEEKFFMGPVIFNCLITPLDQQFPESDLGTDFEGGATFKFLRDDLVDANYVAETGDVIFYQEAYYEVFRVQSNQYFVGKNPDYPNNVNPLNPGLERFGTSLAVVCNTYQVPGDKLGISRERII